MLFLDVKILHAPGCPDRSDPNNNNNYPVLYACPADTADIHTNGKALWIFHEGALIGEFSVKTLGVKLLNTIGTVRIVAVDSDVTPGVTFDGAMLNVTQGRFKSKFIRIEVSP